MCLHLKIKNNFPNSSEARARCLLPHSLVMIIPYTSFTVGMYSVVSKPSVSK